MSNATWVDRLLSRITRIRPGEGTPALLFFLHAFLLLASYQMVKALREAFMLSKFSAETRAYAVAAMALLLMVAVPLYGRLRRRLDGAQLLRVVTLFFAVTLPVFALLFQNHVPIAFAFYIWVSIYGVMVVAQLWAFAADSFNVRSGQRLFVVIMLGANVGALAGAKFTGFAVSALKPMGLMIVATCTLASTLLLARPERATIPDGSRAVRNERRAAPAPRLFGGIGLVFRDRYLLMIAVFVVLLNWINSTGEFILADFVKTHAAASAPGASDEAMGLFIASFYGNFSFWVTLISLAIQLLLVSRIFQLVGVRGALLVHPVIVTAGYALLVAAPLVGGFIPIFSLIRRIKVADNGVDYSLMNTTRQTLFLPVDQDSKYDGKIAIDTFFVRFGDLFQAVGVFIGLNLLGWHSHQFAVLNLVLSLAWIGLAVLMGRAYVSKTQANISHAALEAREAIPDLLCVPGRPFSHPIPTSAFSETDPGDVLLLRAACHDGRPLPRWVRFDVWRSTFFGTAPEHHEHTELRITVTASNMDGLKAHNSFSVRRDSGRSD
ncbi:MAG TPA: Npt1/Npt2 family nucleotide transporter [Steroidobacteraceae bacterium]|nr:Npt1/Npt2 family nucleotide transporter [Steroidobacteraceae bacterium]